MINSTNSASLGFSGSNDLSPVRGRSQSLAGLAERQFYCRIDNYFFRHYPSRPSRTYWTTCRSPRHGHHAWGEGSLLHRHAKGNSLHGAIGGQAAWGSRLPCDEKGGCHHAQGIVKGPPGNARRVPSVNVQKLARTCETAPLAQRGASAGAVACAARRRLHGEGRSGRLVGVGDEQAGAGRVNGQPPPWVV
jgi:hypothetical protein